MTDSTIATVSQTASADSKACDQLQAQIAHLPRKDHWLTPTKRIFHSIFGQIYLGQDTHGNCAVVKSSCLKRFLDNAQRVAENPLSEAAIHRKLFIAASKSRHVGAHGILDFYDEYINDNSHFVVMEHADGGDLFSAVESRGNFDETLARDTFIRLAEIVAFMHEAGVAHLDLKSENWMLTKEGYFKIIDFGMALVVEDAKQKVRGGRGTTMYMAPEIYNGQPFLPFAADVYSLGVILFLMLAAGHPYNQPTSTDKQFRMIYGNRTGIANMLATNDNIPGHSLVNDLLASMLCPEGQRLTLEQVLAHPWVTNKSGLRKPTHQRFVKPQSAEEKSFVDFAPIRQTSSTSCSSSSSCSSTPSPTPAASPSCSSPESVPMDTSS